MEKFALLDFLKVFEALSANGNKNKEENPPLHAEKQPAANVQQPQPELLSSDFNAMANVLSRHEVIANRIRNKH